jgi:O-antigen/teichoic acid export membrane protein
MDRVWWYATRSKGALSIVDQALISAGNFATGVILARTLEPAAFGIYVVASLAFWFTLTVQNGLLLTPLSINGAALDEHAFCRFFRANLPLQAGLAILFSAAVGLTALVWEPVRAVALPLTVVALFWQTQEFCRRVLYTRGLLGSAAVNNAVNYDLQIPLLGVLALLGRLTLPTALWIMALTSLMATLFGAWQLRRFAVHERDDVWAVARSALHIAKWTTPSSVFLAAATQWYPAFVSALLGLASAGALGVINQLLNPLNLLTRPIQNYYLPAAVRTLTLTGTVGLNRVLQKAALMMAPAYLLYTLVVVAVPSLLLQTIYGSAYVGYAGVLRTFALVLPTYIPVCLLWLELNARRQQKYILVGEMWLAIEACVGGWLLIERFGIVGVAYAIGIGLVGQLLLYGGLVLRARLAGRGSAGLGLAEWQA